MACEIDDSRRIAIALKRMLPDLGVTADLVFIDTRRAGTVTVDGEERRISSFSSQAGTATGVTKDLWGIAFVGAFSNKTEIAVFYDQATRDWHLTTVLFDLPAFGLN